MKLFKNDVASPPQKVPPLHITSPSFPALSTLLMRVMMSLPDCERGTVPFSSSCAQHLGQWMACSTC